jgi:leucine-zipper of insertion element IS481
MPEAQISTLQLPLFTTDSPAYQEALARYEEIRPILKQERTLAQHSRETGFNYWRLWRDLRRFTRSGLLGLIDRRKLPHPWGEDLH